MLRHSCCVTRDLVPSQGAASSLEGGPNLAGDELGPAKTVEQSAPVYHDSRPWHGVESLSERFLIPLRFSPGLYHLQQGLCRLVALQLSQLCYASDQYSDWPL